MSFHDQRAFFGVVLWVVGTALSIKFSLQDSDFVLFVVKLMTEFFELDMMIRDMAMVDGLMSSHVI